MEQSTGSSTSKRGSLTRPIGRHWFQGIVIPGIMLSNRNLQAEWFPRVDIELEKSKKSIEGTVLVRNGSLPHMFPGGDPVLKQFYITITVKDAAGNEIGRERQRFGLDFEQLIRGPIPQPLVNGGMTRKVPFKITILSEAEGKLLEATLTYALIPQPSQALKDRYLSTLATPKEKELANKIIEDYSAERLLTFRSRPL